MISSDLIRGLFACLAGLFVASFALEPASADTPAYAAESLLIDLERIVDAEESRGWFVDTDAVAEMRSDLLQSICRTPPEARQRALAALERERVQTGDARALHVAEGGRLTGAVERALFVERKLGALRAGLGWAEKDCPFWVETDREFGGRQTDRDRFTLNFESGGNAQLRQTQGSVTIGAGGLARLLVGRGFGGRFSLLSGVEFGGGAMLKPDVSPTEFVVNYFPAVPIVFRLHDVAWHYDAELAPVALFQADNSSFSFGARAGVALGVAVLRTRGVIPWAGAALGYEYYFPGAGRPRAHFVRGGFRVGFVWDG